MGLGGGLLVLTCEQLYSRGRQFSDSGAILGSGTGTAPSWEPQGTAPWKFVLAACELQGVVLVSHSCRSRDVTRPPECTSHRESLRGHRALGSLGCCGRLQWA